MEFMQQHLGMNMDGAGLSQQQPPPPPAPPPHDQQQLSQIDPVDPPQQGDNVERRWSGSVPRRYLALCGSGALERNPTPKGGKRPPLLLQPGARPWCVNGEAKLPTAAPPPPRAPVYAPP
ncbi:hypothetical protein Sjap_008856 [Stephania japonica]|uniref:Uncharacterized protein n=1 Tax=Stephania japonica TaxID=461633 RepID=A0AAP0PBS3_9MAGN